MRLSCVFLLSCTASLSTISVYAADITIQNQSPHVLEEVYVTGSTSDHILKASALGVKNADSAQLLKSLPGADVNTNGPLTGISHYRGVFGARINTQVDGINALTGGPNWMDPPLSYAPSLWVESLELHRGISPVSEGVNYLSGHINAKLKKIERSNTKNWAFSGQLNTQFQSNNDAAGLGVIAGSAKDNAAIWIRALTEQADDQVFPSGMIMPTKYDRSRIDLGGEYQSGKHTISGFIGRNETGESGTPALPMDIIYIDSNLAKLNYQYQTEQLTIKATVIKNNIDHEMNNFTLRPGPEMAMRYRSTLAEGSSSAAKLDFIYSANNENQQTWLWGIEAKTSKHSAMISNPNNAMFFVNNFNKASLTILSAYLEQKVKLTSQWHTDVGIRLSEVEHDSAKVGTSMAMMMPPAKLLRDKFNQSDRGQSDELTDWHFINTYKLEKNQQRSQKIIIGFSRKSRAASYQERYLWLPMQATAGLADGNTYIGNLNLDPEILHQIELGYELESNKVSFAPRLFFQRIHDYIQGIKTNNRAAIMASNMMGAAKLPLQFGNIDAEIYGFDLVSRISITQTIDIKATAQWIKGVQTDGNKDNLYRISPPKISFALLKENDNWLYGAKWTGVKKQKKVANFNDEKPTSGYTLVDAFAQYKVSASFNLTFAVDNLFDREYQNHLNGYNRAKQKDFAIDQRLTGTGRNAQIGLNYLF